MKFQMALPFFPESERDWILGEIKKILDGDAVLSMGSHVRDFEREFASYSGVKYAVAMSTCSAALEISLRSIGLKTGDEVIVPVQTFVATGASVLREGGTPVFCDINPETFCLSLDALKRALTPRTKAVILVHMAGLITPEVFAIKELCKSRGVTLIEDAAHAPGASINGIKAGALGDMGCFSFYPTKVMTTAEGGMFTTNDEALLKKALSFRSRGLDVDASVERYAELGTNNRISELHAILGRSQLRHLDDFISKRGKIAAVYDRVLSEGQKAGLLRLVSTPAKTVNCYWRYIAVLGEGVDRAELKRRLAQDGIPVDWAYDPPLHLQPVFQKLCGTRPGSLPETELLMSRHVCLPIHYQLDTKDAEHIGQKVLEYVKRP